MIAKYPVIPSVFAKPPLHRGCTPVTSDSYMFVVADLWSNLDIPHSEQGHFLESYLSEMIFGLHTQ